MEYLTIIVIVFGSIIIGLVIGQWLRNRRKP
jgi:uncharacterized protein YneF (UPF0154 family)